MNNFAYSPQLDWCVRLEMDKRRPHAYTYPEKELFIPGNVEISTARAQKPPVDSGRRRDAPEAMSIYIVHGIFKGLCKLGYNICVHIMT